MRKILQILPLALLTPFFAFGSAAVYEPFAYADGLLGGDDGGTGFSGGWTAVNRYHVENETLITSLAQTGSASRGLASDLADDFYFSIDYSYSGTLGVTVNDVFYFSDGSTNVLGVGWYRFGDSSTYRVSLMNGGSTTYIDNAFAYVAGHQVVGNVKFNGDDTVTLTVWIDPTGVETAPYSESITLSYAGSGLDTVKLVRYSSGSGETTIQQNVDSFAIGATWNDVTQIPEESTSVMLGLLASCMVLVVWKRGAGRK
ncbi:MAG: hypothetical protein Q7Q73_05070 [Verrucomicrobiota bacterium JB024]|nr:hypothetical protein [Verrucomicrobiota bacterium JB024]